MPVPARGRSVRTRPVIETLSPSLPPGSGPLNPPAARRGRRSGTARLGAFRPGTTALARLFGRGRQDVTAAAADRWEIAPATWMEIKPARCLPGQIDRIRGAEFGTVDEVVRDFEGGFDALQPATMGYRLNSVLLHDGVLYASDGVRHLRRRSSRLPVVVRAPEYEGAALYESWLGNRWFGNWLFDDCLTYRLAESAGVPFTTGTPIGHKPEYERRLGMMPQRVSSAWFHDLILFDDFSHNAHRRARAADMRRRLVGPAPIASHPGVFLLRGETGDARVLVNEEQVAETLRSKCGFTVIDPTVSDVDQIVRACAGARVIAGVEGSHLVHGLVAMPDDAAALVIQPPTRAVSALKLLTDMQGQEFALVVAEGGEHAFIADADEIERTLDLL